MYSEKILFVYKFVDGLQWLKLESSRQASNRPGWPSYFAMEYHRACGRRLFPRETDAGRGAQAVLHLPRQVIGPELSDDGRSGGLWEGTHGRSLVRFFQQAGQLLRGDITAERLLKELERSLIVLGRHKLGEAVSNVGCQNLRIREQLSDFLFLGGSFSSQFDAL